MRWESFHANCKVEDLPDGSTRYSREANSEFDVALGPALTSGRHEWLVESGPHARGWAGIALTDVNKRTIDDAKFCGVASSDGNLDGRIDGCLRNTLWRPTPFQGKQARLILDMNERTLHVAIGTAAPQCMVRHLPSPVHPAICSGFPGSYSVFVTRPVVSDGAEGELAIVGARTREQREAEGRRRAINLDLDTPRKRKRTAPGELETRVATARSLCSNAVDERALELIKPAVAEFMGDRIDEQELKRRKAQAREQAANEHPPLVRLDEAYADYKHALAARVQAEDTLDATVAAEDAAQAKLEAAMRELLPQQAGASSAKTDRAWHDA